MVSIDLQVDSLIQELYKQTLEIKDVYEQTFAEVENQRAENERACEELRKLTEETRQNWEEEKTTIQRLQEEASDLINLNVGGEKIMTSRVTLTVVKGTVLATIFSGQWDDQLPKDSDGNIFLDYDPVLFNHLLKHLRTWVNNPASDRVFHPLVNSQESFKEFIKSLKFDTQYIFGRRSIISSVKRVHFAQEDEQDSNEKTTSTANTADALQREQEVERFQIPNNADICLSNNGRKCQKSNEKDDWQCVFGTTKYSIGVHQIQLKVIKPRFEILIGICSENKQPNGPYFYDKSTTHGWFTSGRAIKNGQKSEPIQFQTDDKDILDLELTIDCDRKSLSILNKSRKTQDAMQVNINEAPFPWCLLVILHYEGSEVLLL